MSLRRNVIANYLGQGWRTIMSLAFVPLYIKYMGMEAYGLIGIFAVLQTWLSLLDMGMKPALGREMARFIGGAHNAQLIWDLLRSVELISVAIALFLAIGVWVASDWLAADWVRSNQIPSGSVAQAFSLMGLVTALQFVESVYTSSITGLQRQVLQNVIMSAMATVRCGGALAVLVWVSPTVTTFFIWQALVSVISVGISAWVIYRVLPFPQRPATLSMPALVNIWRFAAGMIGITFLSLLLTQIDKLVLSNMLTLEEFGFYTLASVIVVTLYALINPVTAAYYPRFVELLAKRDEVGLRISYHQGAQLVTVAMGSAAIVLMVNADAVIQLWVSDMHITKKVSPLVTVLTLSTLLNGLMWIPFQMQVAHGWTSLTMKINSVAVVFVVPTIFAIVPAYGAIGAAWVGVALNASCMLFGIYFMYSRILSAEKWIWLAEDILAPLAVACTAAFACASIMPVAAGKIEELVAIAISSFVVITVTACSASLVRIKLIRFLFR